MNVVKSTIVSEKIIAQLKEHAMSLSFTPAENKHSCGTLIFKVPGKANSVTTAPVELQAPRQEFPIQEETEVNSSTSQNRHVPDNQAEQSSPVVASQSVSQPVQSDVKTASSPEKAVVPQEKIVSPAAVATSVNASQQARDVNQNAQMQSPSKPAVQAESKPLPTNVTQTEKAQSSASIPNTAVTSNSMKLGVMDNISLEIKGIDLQTRKILSVPDIENYSNEKGSIFFNFCVDKNGIVTYIQYDMNQTDDVSNKLISMIQTKARTFVFAASGKEEECGTFEFKLKKIKY